MFNANFGFLMSKSFSVPNFMTIASFEAKKTRNGRFLVPEVQIHEKLNIEYFGTGEELEAEIFIIVSYQWYLSNCKKWRKSDRVGDKSG